jgi:hypothetical protein
MNTRKEKIEEYVRKFYKSYDVENLEVIEIDYGVRVLKDGKSPLYLSNHQLLQLT